jgi:hypothetical protein
MLPELAGLGLDTVELLQPFFPFRSHGLPFGLNLLGTARDMPSGRLTRPNALYHLPEGIVPRQFRNLVSFAT